MCIHTCRVHIRVGGTSSFTAYLLNVGCRIFAGYHGVVQDLAYLGFDDFGLGPYDKDSSVWGNLMGTTIFGGSPMLGYNPP